MGWSTGTYPLSSQIQELTGEFKWDDGTPGRVLCHCYRRHTPSRGNLWLVEEGHRQDGTKELVLSVCQLAYSQSSGLWGYARSCVADGPVELDCPLEYLDMVPATDSEYDRAWRQRVTEHHHGKRTRTAGQRAC